MTLTGRAEDTERLEMLKEFLVGNTVEAEIKDTRPMA
jgi:hypothetical protein